MASNLGERVHVIVNDLSSLDGAQRLVDETCNAMDEINILVNNAGLTRDNLAIRMKDED